MLHQANSALSTERSDSISYRQNAKCTMQNCGVRWADRFEGEALDAEQKHCSMTGMHSVCFRFVEIAVSC